MKEQLTGPKRFYFYLVALVWTDTILLRLVRACFMRVPVLGAYPDDFIALLYIVAIVGALPYVINSVEDLLYMLGVGMIYLISGVAAYNHYWEEGATLFLVETLPLYVVGRTMMEKSHRSQVLYMLYVLSMATIIGNILQNSFLGTPMDTVQSKYQGNMDRAYKMLPHVAFVIYYAFRHTNRVNISIGIIGGLYLSMMGSRGPLLILLLIIFYCMMTKSDGRIAYLRAITTLLLGVVFIYSNLFNIAVKLLIDVASQFGMSVRIFEKLLVEGGISDDSGRNLLRTPVLEQIALSPVIGHGLFADRTIIGTYVHNIVYELWLDFGVLLGSVVFCYFLLTPIAAFLGESDPDTRGWLVIIFGCGIVKLFFSGSFLIERMLFFLMGCAHGVIRETRQTAANVLAVRPYRRQPGMADQQKTDRTPNKK